LTIAGRFVVDDAIVFVENIFRHLESRNAAAMRHQGRADRIHRS